MLEEPHPDAASVKALRSQALRARKAAQAIEKVPVDYEQLHAAAVRPASCPARCSSLSEVKRKEDRQSLHLANCMRNYAARGCMSSWGCAILLLITPA